MSRSCAVSARRSRCFPSGEVSNQIRIKIANRSGEERSYTFELVDADGLTLVAPENPLVVAGGDSQMTGAFITTQPSSFIDGEHRDHAEDQRRRRFR